MSETIRVLRVLEYTGERSEVEAHLATRWIKGQRTMNTLMRIEAGDTPFVIREAYLGDFPEVIDITKES